MKLLIIPFLLIIGIQTHAEMDTHMRELLPLAVSEYYDTGNISGLKEVIDFLREELNDQFTTALNKNENIKKIILNPQWENNSDTNLQNEKNLRDLVKLYLINKQRWVINTIAGLIDRIGNHEYKIMSFPVKPQSILSQPFIQQLQANDAIILNDENVNTLLTAEMSIRSLMIDSLNRADTSKYIQYDQKKAVLYFMIMYYQYAIAEANFDLFFSYWAKSSPYMEGLSSVEGIGSIENDDTKTKIYDENIFLQQLVEYTQSLAKSSYNEAKHLAKMNSNNEYSELYLNLVSMLEKNHLEEQISDIAIFFQMEWALMLRLTSPSEMIDSLQQELIPEKREVKEAAWPRRRTKNVSETSKESTSEPAKP